jgi:serine/threonine protein phosphatase PrpC
VGTERQVWASTHVGRVRAVNEDRCLVGDWQSGGQIDNWQGVMSTNHGWAVVADGMGGHAAGEVASRVVLNTIASRIGTANGEADVVNLLEAANLSLFEAMYGHDGRPAMGATVVGALLLDAVALIFNVGDSRAYRADSTGLVQLSRDDSLGGKTARGRRSHAVTQSLGGTIRRTPLRPHVEQAGLALNAMLLLCSDGLTDMLDDVEIAGVLARNMANPAERLVAAALDAGGRDNVTVVVVGPIGRDGEGRI